MTADINRYRQHLYSAVMDLVTLPDPSKPFAKDTNEPEISLFDEAGEWSPVSVCFENETTDQFGANPSESEKPWLKVVVSDVDSQYPYLNSTHIRTDGLLVLTVFSPVGEGIMDTDTLAGGLQMLLKGAVGNTGIRFKDESYKKRIGIDSRFSIDAVTLPWYVYDDSD